MKKAKAIWFILRAPFLTVTFGGVFVGTAFAKWETGALDIFRFLLAFAGAACFHLATNIANDYFDFKAGTDAANRSGTSPFSGGSQMLLQGFLKPGTALALALGFTVLGSAIGFYFLAVTPGFTILFVGLGAIFLVYNYNGWPLRLVNYGLGEFGIFLGWGPLMVFGAYFVQTERLGSLWILGPSAVSGILTMLVLLINEFADRDADEAAGRKTLVILIGYKMSLKVFLGFAFVCYAIVVIGIAAAGWPIVTLFVFATIPLPLQAYSAGRRNIGEWPRFLSSVKATILMNLLFLVILGISLIY